MCFQVSSAVHESGSVCRSIAVWTKGVLGFRAGWCPLACCGCCGSSTCCRHAPANVNECPVHFAAQWSMGGRASAASSWPAAPTSGSATGDRHLAGILGLAPFVALQEGTWNLHHACMPIARAASAAELGAWRFHLSCVLHLSELSLPVPVRNPAAAAWCSGITMRSSGRGRPATFTLVGGCCSLQLLPRNLVLRCAKPAAAPTLSQSPRSAAHCHASGV